MDLLCTENIILNDFEIDLQQQHCNGNYTKSHQYQQIKQQQQQQQQKQYSSSNTVVNKNNNNQQSVDDVDDSGGDVVVVEAYSNGTATAEHLHLVSYNNNSPATTTTTTTATAAAAAAANTHQNQQQQQQYNYNDNVYTTNLINRSLDHVNTAVEDPTFLTDRILENALKAEEKYPSICTYFKTVQKDITPPMRKIVAEWMMEVCAEQKCQEEVVLLALNYMDRFLSSKSVRKTQLQILAAACLLLASKLREPSCRALSADLLVFYTDNSIDKSDLIQWELFVLARLKWDLSAVTPLDFLELLLIRLPIRSTKCPDLNVDKVRQHAQAFISLAAKEHYFSMYSASTIAASSIAAALSGLNWHLRSGRNLRYLLNRLTDLTSVEQDYLHDCMMKMEAIFEEHSRNLQSYLVSIDAQKQQQQQQQQQHQQLQHHNNNHHHHHQNQHHNHHNLHHQNHHHQHQHHPQHHHHHHHTMVVANNNNNNNNNNSLLPDLTQTCKMQANNQKDIQDIKF